MKELGECRNTFDLINKYKLASSEGVNKFSNRMIRFEVMKKIYLDGNDLVENHLNDLAKQLS
ncbi:hypothetical protein [Psychrobacillus antarcticus]|uniref:hypothetical protein n=1 Tax=Psychrobacillus antarcticus TaxID=2879115 RepID=UPI0024088EF7|nr:hypothetical protein [Psychrobacillus antarcticus]